MILYNVTTILEEDVHEKWLTWMVNTHIPQVMATGKFVSNRVLKVLDSPNEGITYCSQYIAENLADFEDYKQNYAPALQADLAEKFEGKFVAFRSLMEYIN